MSEEVNARRGRDRGAAFLRAGRRPLPSQRTAIVMMVRDEIDVLPYFLAHHLELVARIYVADHRSVDGTRDYLLSLAALEEYRARIQVFRHDASGYFQPQITKALAHRAFEDGADWVLALDADEFLGCSSRSDLLLALEGSGSPLGLFEWVHLIPRVQEGSPADAEFDPRADFETISQGIPARFGKLAIHRTFADRFPRFRLTSGNHWVHAPPSPSKLFGQPLGTLFHVPARSVAQVARKRQNFVQGSKSDGVQVGEARLVDFEQQFTEARRLLEEGITAQGALELFEQVVLDYEAPELRTRSRDTWIRTQVPLPVTASPPESSPLLQLRLTARAAPVDPAVLQQGGPRDPEDAVARVTVDGRIQVGRAGPRRLRDRLERSGNLLRTCLTGRASTLLRRDRGTADGRTAVE